MSNEIFIGFFIWALKEAYQSFIGSRAKTLNELDSLKRQVTRLEVMTELLRNSIIKAQSDDLRRARRD